MISRPDGQNWSTMTSWERLGDEEDMEELRQLFKVDLESYDLPDDWSHETWDLVWEECEPPCPACAPEYTDHEYYDVYLHTPSPSLSDIESSSP